MITKTRKGNAAFFEMSGLRYKKRDTQRPFLAFVKNGNKTVVEVIESPERVVKLPARTRLMKQWPGKSRSDYYEFTVADLRQHLRENPKKHSFQVI